MLRRLRGRSTPLEWFIAGLIVAFAFYAWSFWAWHNAAAQRTNDQARNTYTQCLQNAQRSADTHEVLVGILNIAADGDMTKPRVKAITDFIDKKLPPRDCSALKP